MRKYVTRLILCGVPRKTAMCVCADFKRQNKLNELAKYVAMMEEQADV